MLPGEVTEAGTVFTVLVDHTGTKVLGAHFSVASPGCVKRVREQHVTDMLKGAYCL